MEPVYVVLSSPRDMPGKVSGKGQQVGEGWLNKAEQELGAPVPDQIADKLRDLEFANFDSFRKAFWQEVSQDPALNKQFIVCDCSSPFRAVSSHCFKLKSSSFSCLTAAGN